MSDKYSMDGHKLMWHPERVSAWKLSQNSWELSKKVYPIYVEISPVGHCNHRCVFCALDFMEYQKRELDFDKLKDSIISMGKNGVKSIMFAGEGEPLLYKRLPEIVKICSENGIDTSITTNLSNVSYEDMSIYVEHCSWIKISCNAGNADNYYEIHKSRKFDTVVSNMEKLVSLRNKKKSKCTIGTQMVLLEENVHSLKELVILSKKIGLDYTTVKPYSQHLSSITTRFAEIDYTELSKLSTELLSYNSDDYDLVFRINAIKKWDSRHTDTRYERCHSVPFFWAYIQSDGQVSGCSMFLDGDPIFNLGNINEQNFAQIWESDKRRKLIEYMKSSHSIKDCRVNCRMDEINRYLWELNHPGKHVNFI